MGWILPAKIINSVKLSCILFPKGKEKQPSFCCALSSKTCGSCYSSIWSCLSWSEHRHHPSFYHGMSVDVKVSSCVKSWLDLDIDISSTFIRDVSTSCSPKVSPGLMALRSKERESITTVWCEEPYGACAILGGFPLRYTTFINNILIRRSDRNPGLAFLSVRKLSGTMMVHLEDLRNHQFQACKSV